MHQTAITLDIDWAPDFVIDFVARQLIEHGVRATWFVTHLSPAVEQLRQWPALFELGIHPNFLPGSSHGTTPKAVLDHCMQIVPEAVSSRTHGLVQSTFLFDQLMAHTTITTDVSLFLPHTPFLRPIEYWWQDRRLLRLPYLWEDDFEMERPYPQWELTPLLELGQGLKVFDFHPIHIYLNSADMVPYRMLKDRVPRLTDAVPSQVGPFVQDGAGTRTMFVALMKYLASQDDSLCVRDICEQWQTNRASKKEY